MKHYKSEFKSILNKSYKIEIYDTLGTAIDIVTESTPITVAYESDNLFKPLKISGATIHALVGSPLFELYTGSNQGIKVKLTNTTDNVVEWFGYLSPCCYSSEYDSSTDAIAFEAIDTISSLENIKYVTAGTVPGFRSFQELLIDILDLADPGKVINKVYIADALRFSSADTTSIWTKLCVHESNFLDELKETMTCQDVLAEMLRYLGMTMVQFKDAYYILDYKYLAAGYANFSLYNRTTQVTTTEAVGSTLLRLYEDIGIANSEASVSIGDIYNKVSVIASFNKIGEIVPELFNDEDIAGEDDLHPNAYTTESVGTKTYLYAPTKSKANWAINPVVYYEGSFLSKQSSYITADGEPASINWSDYITATRQYNVLESNTYFTLMLHSLINRPVLLKTGYLILDVTYAISNNRYVDYPSSDAVFYDGQYKIGMYNTRIAIRLKIGDYYWTGTEWRLYSAYLADVAGGYYNKNLGQGTFDGHYKYYYTVGSDTTKIFITEDEYDRIRLRDCFFVTHTNKVGDRIYNTWCNLDNQVSYTMDLVNSKSGYLIPLPDTSLFGAVDFQLYSMDRLGNYINNRSDIALPAVTHFHVKEISLICTNNNFSYNIFTNDVDDSDMIYSNDIDPSFVKEADDVTLKINTYAKNINSLSSVAVRTVNGGVTSYDFLSSLYCRIEGGQFTPEQLLINKLVELYETRTIQYSNCLNRTFTFLNRIYESTLDTTFLVDSMTIDYANEAATVNLISV